MLLYSYRFLVILVKYLCFYKCVYLYIYSSSLGSISGESHVSLSYEHQFNHINVNMSNTNILIFSK